VQAPHWSGIGQINDLAGGNVDWHGRANHSCWQAGLVPRLDTKWGGTEFRQAVSFGVGAQPNASWPSRFAS